MIARFAKFLRSKQEKLIALRAPQTETGTDYGSKDELGGVLVAKIRRNEGAVLLDLYAHERRFSYYATAQSGCTPEEC